MTVNEVREKYLSFFEKRGHAVIPSAPLVPENDPTTLFVSSGMQPLIPYLLGEKHPKGDRLVNSQMCFRAEDIEEVGDNRHTTFFEMLGNWSLGDYFKEQQLPWVFEFLTSKEEGLGLDPKNLYVTVFGGDTESGMSADTESAEIWKKLFTEKSIDAKLVELGTEKHGGELGIQDGRIFSYGAQKNWWSRSGVPSQMPVGEPGGPDSEIFYDFGTPHDTKFGKECHPNCDCGRFVEIGNSVFMQYIKKEGGTFAELPKKNVDFGGGLERMTAATNHNADIFSIDVFNSASTKIAEKVYFFDKEESSATQKQEIARAYIESFRIVLDHIRSATFMLASKITPDKTEQGYVLRRLLRRSVIRSRRIGAGENIFVDIAHMYAKAYENAYPMLIQNIESIQNELRKENEQFVKTLGSAIKELWKLFNNKSKDLSEKMNGQILFHFFTTEGFPAELILEQYDSYRKQEKLQPLTQSETNSLLEDFEKKMKEHQALSREGAAQKFKGGLADTSEETTALHTATHLMLAGLRKYVGENVHQAGSNITVERTRFDFTNPEKVSREILDKVEDYVNEAINKDCVVTVEQVPKETVRAKGIEASFWDKYPDVVNVYTITSGDSVVYSQELCGGPHVKNTKVMHTNGKRFKILKESASSAGVRRIKASFV